MPGDDGSPTLRLLLQTFGNAQTGFECAYQHSHPAALSGVWSVTNSAPSKSSPVKNVSGSIGRSKCTSAPGYLLLTRLNARRTLRARAETRKLAAPVRISSRTCITVYFLPPGYPGTPSSYKCSMTRLAFCKARKSFGKDNIKKCKYLDHLQMPVTTCAGLSRINLDAEVC